MNRMLPTLLMTLLASLIASASPQPASLAPRETADGVLFQCRAPDARTVHLAGCFNKFAGNEGGRIRGNEGRMEQTDAGVFRITVPLPPGVYRYKFAIDGGDTWFAPDYAHRRDEDGNAYLVVDGSPDAEPDVVVARPPFTGPPGTTFELYAPDAHIVFLAGSFNQWARNCDGKVTDHRYAMRGPDAHGIWRATVRLGPGRHTYQFVINGDTWMADPLAHASSGRHSLLEVRP